MQLSHKQCAVKLIFLVTENDGQNHLQKSSAHNKYNARTSWDNGELCSFKLMQFYEITIMENLIFTLCFLRGVCLDIYMHSHLFADNSHYDLFKDFKPCMI